MQQVAHVLGPGVVQITDRPAASVRIAGRLSFVINIEIAPAADESLRPPIRSGS
ncbi:hypothetical protein JJC00_07965 [Bradyrhizobium diazoefficiens]|uniref:hypothetical protein n=1 Tax=Bradyrhizobium diazoefficiens TaxID=1355477 RepID=UPI00190DFDDF|nr:hypothetical protein [Bradyrhizobium diazoefficiens]QQO35545.1 hypothetical protein JJC00_07965 [Bradyrhizobium diazoefficiens]